MRPDAGLGTTLLVGLALLLASCGYAEGLAEDVAGEFIDDQDYELYAGTGSIATLARNADGVDVALLQGALRAGDTADDLQALGVVGFAFDRSFQPDNTRLEGIRLRFWFEPGDGDTSRLGPLVISHVPVEEELLDPTLVPDPPGDDVAAVLNVSSSGWREVDVTNAFMSDWNAGRRLAVFVFRFGTPTDGEGDDDDVDLFPEVDGVVRRAHLVLHFGVNL